MLESGAESERGAADVAAERRVFGEFLASDEADRWDWTYLYQEFLGAFAPERRRAFGVYYTPVEVVRAQVRLAADLLERRLSCRGAFADPRVAIVDPAAGSGAYPLAVVADAIARTGHVPATLKERLRLLEPMVGAASIARARLAATLGGADGLQIDGTRCAGRPAHAPGAGRGVSRQPALQPAQGSGPAPRAVAAPGLY